MTPALIASIIVAGVSALLGLLSMIALGLVSWVFTTSRADMLKTQEQHRDQIQALWQEMRRHSEQFAALAEHRKASDTVTSEAKGKFSELDSKVDAANSKMDRVGSQLETVLRLVSTRGMPAVKLPIPRADG